MRDDPGARAGHGAAIYGYTKLYGSVPGAQAEYLRVPHADYNPIKVPHGPPDDRFLYLSDVARRASEVPADRALVAAAARSDAALSLLPADLIPPSGVAALLRWDE